MERFTITKDIRANGRRWDEIIGSPFQPTNLFGSKDIRDAWKAMEDDFSTETVTEMVMALDKHCDDGDDLVEAETTGENEVTVKYINKRSTLMSTEIVKYILNGNLEEPKEYLCE